MFANLPFREQASGSEPWWIIVSSHISIKLFKITFGYLVSKTGNAYFTLKINDNFLFP